MNQAKEEIWFVSKEVLKIFQKFGIEVKEFKKVWDKLRNKIKKYNFGFYPEILTLIFKKDRI